MEKISHFYSGLGPQLHEDIENAGLDVFKYLYKGTRSESLDDLMYTKYMNLLSKSTQIVQPESLPPTANAAKYHIYCVYLQIQVRINLNSKINAED